MKNPVYRITVEVIGDEKDHEIGNTLREGVECDGFAIIANKGKSGQMVVHSMNHLDLACLIAANDDLMGASVIAKALREASDIWEGKPGDILAGTLGSISK